MLISVKGISLEIGLGWEKLRQTRDLVLEKRTTTV